MAKRMQRPIAASSALPRISGACGMPSANVMNALPHAQRNALIRPPLRSFRQALHPQRFPISEPNGFRPKRCQIRSDADLANLSAFRTATQSSTTPVFTAVACRACVKGIEKICVVTSNDADFVR
ncbi:hypothetical protein [Pandoraea anapnoica]|uniref:hypothetical protein n=1 Tax=Pandoraea anapnoica TaxID=2508301 RepID=UPI0012422601|nr:hypothetical protein [Pandoraea anapnoica]